MTPDPIPADPMTELAEGANQLHELFLEYVKAGFTEQQALYLLGQILGTAAKGGN